MGPKCQASKLSSQHEAVRQERTQSEKIVSSIPSIILIKYDARDGNKTFALEMKRLSLEGVADPFQSWERRDGLELDSQLTI